MYRVTIAEMPFVAAVFPLGGPTGVATSVEIRGWNLEQMRLESAVPRDAPPGMYWVAARGRGGLLSNRFPLARDDLPEVVEKEPNNGGTAAQRVTPPLIVNGLIHDAADRDVFEFEGRAGDRVVAEIRARWLDSSLDSLLTLTDTGGRLIAINDDHEDTGAGLTTHHADSLLIADLPSNGLYRVTVADTQHNGGLEYGYRLRISPPRPEFDLLVVPSGLTFRSNGYASATVHLIRRDRFTGPVRLRLAAPQGEFEMAPVTLDGTQTSARVSIRARRGETHVPVALRIEGIATNAGREIVRVAAGAEDRMQAFLWRHLVPAQELAAIVLPPPGPPRPAVAAAPLAPPPPPAGTSPPPARASTPALSAR